MSMYSVSRCGAHRERLSEQYTQRTALYCTDTGSDVLTGSYTRTVPSCEEYGFIIGKSYNIYYLEI